MYLYAHSGHSRALELVRVDEQGHRGDAKCITGTPGHREPRRVLDHISTARWIRHINRQTGVVDLDEVGQGNLEVTVFGLIEAKSMVDRGHRGHNVILLRHRRVLSIHQDKDADFPRPDDVLARLNVGSLRGLALAEELEEQVDFRTRFQEDVTAACDCVEAGRT